MDSDRRDALPSEIPPLCQTARVSRAVSRFSRCDLISRYGSAESVVVPSRAVSPLSVGDGQRSATD